MELVGFILTVIGLLYAVWQHVESRRASKRASQSEGQLQTALNNLPRQIAEALQPFARRAMAGDDPVDVANIPEMSLTGSLNALDHVDIDHDGREELLVQYPGGAHGSVLQIFGFREGVFGEIGSLATGTPSGFRWGDFDGDGKVELESEDVDWGTGEPYVSAPRVLIRWRWNGHEFAEVSRERLTVF